MRVLPLIALASVLSAPAPPQSSPLTPGAVLLMAAGTTVDTAMLTAALADPNPLVRAAAGRVATVFGVVSMVGPMVTALEKETDPATAAEFVRALLIVRGDAAVALIEPHAQRLGGAPVDVLTEWRQRSSRAASVAAVPNDLMFSRLVPLWQAHMLRDLTEAAGCKLPDNAFGYARLTYRADGRPMQVGVDAGKLSKACASVLGAIARTTLADPADNVQEGLQQWIVVPFSKHYVQCVDVRQTAPVVQMGTAGLRPPKKVKDVRPDYPDDMRQQRIQGVVGVGATISANGCGVGASIIKSPAFGLELSALRAVSGWVFEPTRFDGKPVPVWMSVMVTFRLQ